MAKENLSNHRDTEDTHGTPVAAGSGRPARDSKDSDRSVWLPYVIAGVAIVVCGVIIWCII